VPFPARRRVCRRRRALHFFAIGFHCRVACPDTDVRPTVPVFHAQAWALPGRGHAASAAMTKSATNGLWYSDSIFTVIQFAPLSLAAAYNGIDQTPVRRRRYCVGRNPAYSRRWGHVRLVFPAPKTCTPRHIDIILACIFVSFMLYAFHDYLQFSFLLPDLIKRERVG